MIKFIQAIRSKNPKEKRNLTLKSIYILLFCLVWGVGGAKGQAFSGTFSFASATGNVASLTYNGSAITNLTVSALVKTGVTTASSSGNSRATTWPTGSTNGGAAGGSIDAAKYYEFTITGASGYTITNPTITFGVGRSGTGPRRFEWRSSLNSYASALTVGTANASLSNSSGVLESPDANSGYTGNIISVTSSGQNSITFRFYAYGSEAGTGTGGLEGNLTFGGTLNSSNPTVLTSGTLSSFLSSGISSPSTEQTFTVSGTNLTNNIVITPPTGYQVSSTSGSGFGSSVTLTQSGGTVNTTTIYTRFNPSALTEQVGGNITCASTGASTQNVAVTGEVTNLSVGAIAFIAFQGATTDYFRIVALEDIPANTRIWFTDKAWDGNGGTLAFTSGEGNSVWTSPNSTVTRGTVIEFAVGAGTVNLGTGAFTSGLGSAGEQLFAYQGTLTSPTFIAGFTSGTTIATGVPTASGTDTWVPASLTTGTNFIALGGITFGSSYLTVSTINRSLSDMRSFIHNFDNLTTSNTSTTTYSSWPAYTFNFIADEPTSQPSFTAASNVGNNQMDLNFSGGNGTSYLVIMREGSAVNATPTDATNYSAVSGTVNFSSATELSAGQRIVYNGTTSTGTVTVTNLSPGTTYHYAIYAYNGTTTTANFYLTSPGTGNQLTTGSANSNASDIIASASFTEPSNIAYASNQENTDLTFANSIEVAQFTLRDGGATTDGDANSTTINSITFTIANHAALRRLALYDGSTELGEVAISSGTATFSGLTLAANDNSTNDFSLRASFAGTITDNTQFSFTISSATADIAGSTFAAANAGGAATSTTDDRNKIEVTATLLAFVQNTSNVSVLTAMSPAPSVSANDALGNRDLDYVTDMVATTTGTFDGAATTTETPVSGLATFDNLQFQYAETGINIAVSSGALTPSGNSNDFDISYLIMPGEIAFVRYQTDAPDAFSIITFVEIPANQTFYFTDNAWTTASGPLNTNENTMTWTTPASVISEGTVITFTDAGSTTNVTPAGNGSASGVLSGLSASGEQILMYRGTNSTTPTAFICGVSTTSWLTTGSTTSNTSYLPSDLTLNVSGVTFTSHQDNGYYNGTQTGSIATLKSLVNNGNNWLRSTSPQSAPTWSFDVYSATTTISANATVQDLSLDASETFEIGANTLTINGTVSGSGTITGGTSSNLTIGGSAGTIQFTSGSNNNFLRNLTLNASSSLTIGNALNITGGATPGVVTVASGATLTTGGNLTLKSDASGTASIGNSAGSISGSYTVERYIPGGASRRRTRFLASPVVGGTALQWRNNGTNSTGLGIQITGNGGASNGFDVSNNTNNPASAWTYTQGATVSSSGSNGSDWTGFTTGSMSLTNGQGYRVLVRGDRMTNLLPTPGDPINTTSTNTTISVTGTYPGSSVVVSTTRNETFSNGWNLVGNPYPSPINWSAVTKGSDVDGSYWVYDPSGGTYASHNGSSGTATNLIASGQGFFVRRNTGTTGSLGDITFNEASKTSGSGHFLGKSQIQEFEYIMKYDSNNFDKNLIVFDANYSDADDNFDTDKLSNTNINICTKNINGRRLSINSLKPIENEEKVISIDVSYSVLAKYTLEFARMESLNNLEILLKDKYLNKTVIVTPELKYAFELTSDANSTGENRFEFIFRKSATGLNNELSSNNNNFIVFPNPANNVLNLSLTTTKGDNYSFTIFNQLGEMVNNGNLDFNAKRTHALNIENLSNGVYFIQVKNGKTAQTIKFIK